MNSLAQVRDKFIDFFVKNNHCHIPSSPLIPHNDPSLMFVNSGMVQFKGGFTGQEIFPYKTVTTSQKSVRAGGKHNDLDNVGYTARHHTFFEMLGNFSFGDYFKEQAIKYAFDLLTKEFSIPAEKLYVTVYHDDSDAAALWKKISGFSDEKIIKIATNDNFWSMGDTGPCGPCSEIFYDHGSHIWGGLPGTPEQDGDRFVEIWNLVFMEFEQLNPETRISLPNKSIDTGMGLERISAVLQGVHDNYDIDLFKELIHSAENLFEVSVKSEAKFSYRVIADHLRSISFLIADGVMPSNEGRGYVLRRIMRRAMRHANLLGAHEPIIYKLLPKLIELMGTTYPELKRAEDFTANIIQQEEIRFYSTLDRGLKLLGEETANISAGGILKGEVAFKLYDTYGFPLDLTQDILKSKNIGVDIAGFDQNMEEQKQKARKSWAGSGANKENDIWFEIRSEYGATEFLGYSLDNLEAKILTLIHSNKKPQKISNIDAEFIIITNQTPFYGESGGQMGDTGIITALNCKIKVINTLKYLGIHAHICILEEGEVSCNDNVHLTIDVDYRKNLQAHHSATHILHAVLRETLGSHVVQKGSLVAYDHLRFDFSHTKALTSEEIEKIEDMVNYIILSNSKVTTNLMSTQEAIDLGAMALFGEKYDNEVRVVSMGKTDGLDSSYSFELCGGTHVKRTGDIGSFKIRSEHAIAAGVRRIEAICGKFVLKAMRDNEKLLSQISATLKATDSEIIGKINNLIASNKQLDNELSKIKQAQLDVSIVEIEKLSLQARGYKVICKVIENFDIKTMRLAAANLANNHDQLVVVYINKTQDKLLIVVAINKTLQKKLHAGKIIEKLAIFLGGNGGGGELLAQGNGNDNGKLSELTAKINEFIDNNN